VSNHKLIALGVRLPAWQAAIAAHIATRQQAFFVPARLQVRAQTA